MPRTRRRQSGAADHEDEVDASGMDPEGDDDDVSMAGDQVDDVYEDGAATGDSEIEHMVKNMVRMALACEYSRTPIRRVDITTKVLGTQTRQFKRVFGEAQSRLRTVFGMEMVELPMRDKVTLAQRRAAQKSQSGQKTSGIWVVNSVLPARFRTADILGPSKIPTSEDEARYTALYTFVISLILLSGGSLPDARLDRFLRRANVESAVASGDFQSQLAAMSGSGGTEKLLKRMEKDGYVMRIRDTGSGEETIDWRVGPRGKIQVGEEGARGLAREVYGEVDDPEELERKLDRSLGVNERRPRDGPAPSQSQNRTRQTLGQRSRRADDEQDDEEEDAEGEGEDE